MLSTVVGWLGVSVTSALSWLVFVLVTLGAAFLISLTTFRSLDDEHHHEPKPVVSLTQHSPLFERIGTSLLKENRASAHPQGHFLNNTQEDGSLTGQTDASGSERDDRRTVEPQLPAEDVVDTGAPKQASPGLSLTQQKTLQEFLARLDTGVLAPPASRPQQQPASCTTTSAPAPQRPSAPAPQRLSAPAPQRPVSPLLLAGSTMPLSLRSSGLVIAYRAMRSDSSVRVGSRQNQLWRC